MGFLPEASEVNVDGRGAWRPVVRAALCHAFHGFGGRNARDGGRRLRGRFPLHQRRLGRPGRLVGHRRRRRPRPGHVWRHPRHWSRDRACGHGHRHGCGHARRHLHGEGHAARRNCHGRRDGRHLHAVGGERPRGAEVDLRGHTGCTWPCAEPHRTEGHHGSCTRGGSQPLRRHSLHHHAAGRWSRAGMALRTKESRHMRTFEEPVHG
mmetsp:Transcript_10450/g.29054  ORF Transcript_10450/g.29054 Transcript_10450/m.29054 type:complete len:208 (+) Transcript_10450:131-754(+)